MQRLAFKMKLNKGQKKAYKKRHDELWPELKQLLKDNGVSEYSWMMKPLHFLLFRRFLVMVVPKT